VVTLAIAAGAIPAFSAYLPAFLAVHLPATVPYAVASITSVNPIATNARELPETTTEYDPRIIAELTSRQKPAAACDGQIQKRCATVVMPVAPCFFLIAPG
jgi:hypothetical protein